MRGGVAAFQDSRPFDDPVRIEAKAGVKVIVGNHHVGHVLARSDDSYAG
jgi:hypothetical protein